MCLLSSKSSEKRFLVNFQMTKAIMPTRAMPPATERPMIVDVPTDLLVLSVFWSAPAEGVVEGEAVNDGVIVSRMVVVPPSASVVRYRETVGVGVGCWGGEGDGELSVGGVDDGLLGLGELSDVELDDEVGLVVGIEDDVCVVVVEDGVVVGGWEAGDDPPPPEGVVPPDALLAGASSGGRRSRGAGWWTTWCDSRRSKRGTSENTSTHDTHARRTRHRVGVKSLSIELESRIKRE